MLDFELAHFHQEDREVLKIVTKLLFEDYDYVLRKKEENKIVKFPGLPKTVETSAKFYGIL